MPIAPSYAILADAQLAAAQPGDDEAANRTPDEDRIAVRLLSSTPGSDHTSIGLEAVARRASTQRLARGSRLRRRGRAPSLPGRRPHRRVHQYRRSCRAAGLQASIGRPGQRRRSPARGSTMISPRKRAITPSPDPPGAERHHGSAADRGELTVTTVVTVRAWKLSSTRTGAADRPGVVGTAGADLPGSRFDEVSLERSRAKRATRSACAVMHPACRGAPSSRRALRARGGLLIDSADRQGAHQTRTRCSAWPRQTENTRSGERCGR